MKDIFLNFAELSGQYVEGRDYQRTVLNRGGTILILAIHGGPIERGTSELAKAVAGDDLSLYLFESLLRTHRESKALHITSSHFDEPACLALIQRLPHCLALHGCSASKPVIYVGGRDFEMKHHLTNELLHLGYPVELGRSRLPGIYRNNICNRTRTGAGLQLEISSQFRSLLFQNWRKKNGRQIATPAFDQFVADLRSVLE